MCSPKLVEMIGMLGGYDAVWLDQEHTGITLGDIEHAVLAARASGLDSFVRIAATDYATVMRPLEAGAGGIMAAMVRSAREARQVVEWAKFHPHGIRGCNGTGVDGRYGSVPAVEYYRQANEQTFVAIQIEHIDAVREVEQIAALPQIDMLFVGPADLSQSMGLPGQWDHPRMWEALDQVAHAARAHHIHWAILPPNAAYAQRCVKMGCKMLAIGMDVWAIRKGLKAFQADYAEFFPG
jgi:2-dehydro-3-deoxyglucarate aldolase/4-hydroxy-2-oxoheptanedioate aldolase